MCLFSPLPDIPRLYLAFPLRDKNRGMSILHACQNAPPFPCRNDLWFWFSHFLYHIRDRLKHTRFINLTWNFLTLFGNLFISWLLRSWGTQTFERRLKNLLWRRITPFLPCINAAGMGFCLALCFVNHCCPPLRVFVIHIESSSPFSVLSPSFVLPAAVCFSFVCFVPRFVFLSVIVFYPSLCVLSSTKLCVLIPIACFVFHYAFVGLLNCMFFFRKCFILCSIVLHGVFCSLWSF